MVEWLSSYSLILPSHEITLASESLPEKRVTVITLHSTVNMNFNLFERFSNCNKLIRVVAYCLRFYSKLKGIKTSNTCDSLTVPELTAALNRLVLAAQSINFAQEIKDLNKNNIPCCGRPGAHQG